MASSNRPLSPHLMIYEPQLTAILSICHRGTGVALVAGEWLLVFWLAAAAAGPEAFDIMQSVLGHFLGQLALFGWTFCLFYHLCNGIRHLCWDVGFGYDIPVLYRSGWIMVLASGALTVFSWILGYAMMGGS